MHLFLRRACAVLAGFQWLFGAYAVSRASSSEESAGPYFRISGAEPGVDAFPLKSTQVDALLAGVIAEVRVTQTYCNEGSRTLEARYVFPGSSRAAVHAMTLRVGGRVIEAVIREKQEARREYEKAREAGKTASLLESQRSNILDMSVANIQPGDEVTVDLRYTELLVPEAGRYEWVFPTVVGPRYQRAAPENATQSKNAVPEMRTHVPEAEPVFTLTADLVAGVPATGIECVSHPVRVASEGARSRVSYFPDGKMAMNRDFVLRYRLAGEALGAGVMVDEWKGERYFLLNLQPPARLSPALVPPRDYVFVVDVSGSMHGFPINTTKALMRELLMGLRDNDHFNVLLFAGSSEWLSPSPLPATPAAIASAVALLDTRGAGGGTELLSAMERALGLPRQPGVARSVVVVTDGYIDVEAEAYALARSRLGDASLFAFGIGSAVNRELIERLARAGRSEPAVVLAPADVARESARFRAMIESPVLTQARAVLEGVSASDVIPASIPDVLAERPVTLVGKLSGGASGRIVVTGFAGHGPWRAEVDLSRAVDLGGQGTLARLWARERLAELRDQHALGIDQERLRNEIVQLGLRHNLLTPFTSFVAVDTVARAPGAASDAVQQPASLPQGVDAGSEVYTTPEPGNLGLVIVAALIAVWRGTAAARRRRREAA